jgi:hypothetical protein
MTEIDTGEGTFCLADVLGYSITSGPTSYTGSQPFRSLSDPCRARLGHVRCSPMAGYTT